jgi:hypothetical protein
LITAKQGLESSVQIKGLRRLLDGEQLSRIVEVEVEFVSQSKHVQLHYLLQGYLFITAVGSVSLFQGLFSKSYPQKNLQI